MKKQILWLAALLLSAGSATDGFAQSGVRYPYATSEGSTSGKTSVIVSRDGNGGVKTGCIHANWKASAMPAHNDADSVNAVSARFEVAAADLSETKSWADALSGCASYTQAGSSAGDWRLPTQRELMLIYAMYKQGRLPLLSFSSDRYWSSTEYFITSSAWIVSFDDGSANGSGKSTSSRYVRCIRDF